MIGRVFDFVVDASIVVEYLLRTPGGRQADHIIDGRRLAAPELLDAEILSILRRHVARGRLPADRAEALLQDLAAAPVRRIPHRHLVVPAWKHRHNVSAYDALYVALADISGAPLLTADSRLARAPNIGITIHHIRLT